MKLHRAIIATILSFVFCGTGQIYLHKVFRGLVLITSFWVAVFIIWFAISYKEFRLFNWHGNPVIFSPLKVISFGGQPIKVADIMKVTGAIQLLFTWIFGIIDAWREGKSQS